MIECFYGILRFTRQSRRDGCNPNYRDPEIGLVSVIGLIKHLLGKIRSRHLLGRCLPKSSRQKHVCTELLVQDELREQTPTEAQMEGQGTTTLLMETCRENKIRVRECARKIASNWSHKKTLTPIEVLRYSMQRHKTNALG